MSDPQDEMEQEDFATLFAREGAKRALQVGQVVKGRILQIGEETLFVDVGGKGEALIERAELTDGDGNLTVKVGDEIEATVVRSGDDIRLSYRLLQGIQAREGLAVAAQTGLPVEGKVAAVIKGGYEVTVAGLRAFCPFSQMDLRRTDAPEAYVGRVLEFRISRYSEQGRNIVLTRRVILEEQAAEAAEETRKKLLPGAVLPGTVASLAEFGAFVDLGGVQGLIPASEISHSRVGRPADRLHVGEIVTVKVLKIDEAKGRISLSLKALETDPWTEIAGRLRDRQIVRGRVARMTDFGVFVELLPGIDGLLHLTEIPRSRHGEMKKAAETGEDLIVLVTSIDLDKRRDQPRDRPRGRHSRHPDRVDHRGRRRGDGHRRAHRALRHLPARRPRPGRPHPQCGDGIGQERRLPEGLASRHRDQGGRALDRGRRQAHQALPSSGPPHGRRRGDEELYRHLAKGHGLRHDGRRGPAPQPAIAPGRDAGGPRCQAIPARSADRFCRCASCARGRGSSSRSASSSRSRPFSPP